MAISTASHNRCEFTAALRSEEHTSELQSRLHLVCRLLLEKKKQHVLTCLHHHQPTPRYLVVSALLLTQTRVTAPAPPLRRLRSTHRRAAQRGLRPPALRDT